MKENKITQQGITIQGMAPLLQVFDMPVSISFYRDKLGFEIAAQSQPELKDDCDWVLLRLNGEGLMLNTAYERQEKPSTADPIRMAAHADTEIYFGCPDVDAAYNYLRSEAIEVEEPVITKYGWKAIYVTDPDGFLLCFHWPAK